MTGAEIAETFGMPVSTVSGFLTGSGWASSAAGAAGSPTGDQKKRPGQLVHVDVKKLGRIGQKSGHRVTGRVSAGGHHRRDHSAGSTSMSRRRRNPARLRRVLDDEKAVTAIVFLRRAIAHYNAYGIQSNG